jgi:hypothetical protein
MSAAATAPALQPRARRKSLLSRPLSSAKVLGSGEGDEVSEVQPVMCSLLATYFAAAWVGTPWLRFFGERRTSDAPEDDDHVCQQKLTLLRRCRSGQLNQDCHDRSRGTRERRLCRLSSNRGLHAAAVRPLLCACSTKRAASRCKTRLSCSRPPRRVPLRRACLRSPALRSTLTFCACTTTLAQTALAVQRFKVTPTSPNADQLRRGRGKWIGCVCRAAAESMRSRCSSRFTR